MDKPHYWNHHVIGVVSTNCYVFGDPNDAIMLDPGGEEAITIAKKLEENGIEVGHVLVSHGHFDHLGWATEVQNVVEGAKVYLHKDEKPVYEDFIDAMSLYGLPKVDLREPDIWVEHREELNLGSYKFEVIHTPGHSPGSATFLVKDVPDDADTSKIPLQKDYSAFVGDLIFEGSIGRVDLPYSNKDDMIKSLKLVIDELAPDTNLYPGHGNTTVMERELRNNPYLKAIQSGISFY